MYEELVERLKIAAEWAGKGFCITPSLCLEAADAIEELSRRCEQFMYTPPPAWIPVTERLPREEETVLTWGKQGVILLDWLHDSKWCCFGEATHWMPLPEPPKEET